VAWHAQIVATGDFNGSSPAPEILLADNVLPALGALAEKTNLVLVALCRNGAAEKCAPACTALACVGACSL
jgi:hypothetical protein